MQNNGKHNGSKTPPHTTRLRLASIRLSGPTDDTRRTTAATAAAAVKPLSVMDRARIRAVSGCDDRTIRAYPNVGDTSRRRIEAAADELGIRLPRRLP